jgi:N12 class adenine-specific DNA methylase
MVRVIGVTKGEEETLLELEHSIVVTGKHYTTDVITTEEVTYYTINGKQSDLPEEIKSLLESNIVQCNEAISKDTEELDYYRKKLAETTVELRNYKAGKVSDYSDNMWLMESTYRKQINYLRADTESLKAENKALKERYDKLREAYDILLDI